MSKVGTLIQFALKARKTALGDSLIPSIQTKKAKLVLISEICGQNRKKKLIDKCTFYQVPYLETDGQLLNGVSHRTIHSIAICDDGFAQAIMKEMKG